jgi:UDP-N-acetylglucosamine 1-carboxyvinyltransferase
MQAILIEGGAKLKGNVKVSGAKNAVLKLLAASLMTDQTCVFFNVPALADVQHMMELMKGLGAQVNLSDQGVLQVRSKDLGFEAPEETVRKMRASIQVTGPLLARLGKVHISLPGGCDIGDRPVDLHLRGLRCLGANLEESGGYVQGYVKKLLGAHVYLDLPSVGATENILMAATLAKGTTYIYNAAREPEIVEVAKVLNMMGAKIEGAGTGCIRIDGVSQLHGCEYEVIPDRIEAGTYMVAAAMMGEGVTISPVIPEHLRAVIGKLEEAGAELDIRSDSIGVRKGRIKPVIIRTQPHPGFPTDLQPQFVSLLTLAEGPSVVCETIYTSRYKYIDELRRMGANITVQGNVAVVRGVKRLSGSLVTAPDLRAGAALVLAGLAAKGETIIENAFHLDRGYQHLEENLANLGAQIKRIELQSSHKRLIS